MKMPTPTQGLKPDPPCFRFLLGVAGAGKSTALRRLLAQLPPSTHPLILTYNKDPAEDFRLKSGGRVDSSSCMTIDALAKRVLEKVGECPKAPGKEATQEEAEEAQREYFREVRRAFLRLPTEQVIEGILRVTGRKIDILFLDEAQDLHQEDIQIVERLIQAATPEIVYVFGDPSQSITEYRTKGDKKGYGIDLLRRRFAKIGKIEELEPLTEAHRTPAEHLPFVNAVIEKIPRGIKLEGGAKETGAEMKIPVIYHQKVKDELTFVVEQVRLLLAEATREEVDPAPTKKGPKKEPKIVILARHNRALKRMLATLEKEGMRECLDSGTLVLSTVHRFKGGQADNVILMDYHLEAHGEPDEELRILYVAITRHKRRLFISTAHPKAETEDLFPAAYCTIEDRQKPLWDVQRPEINITDAWEWTEHALKGTHMDSNVYSVGMEETPYLKTFKKGDTGGSEVRSEGEAFELINLGGLRVGRRHHYSSRRTYYEFHDLTALNKRGLPWKEIVKYTTSLIAELYDNRIRPEDIREDRLDLAQYTKKETLEDAVEHRNGLIRGYLANPKVKSVRRGDKKGALPLTSADLPYLPHSGAVYENFSSSRTRNRTNVTYLPMFKDNQNKITNIPYLVKEEARYSGEALQTKKVRSHFLAPGYGKNLTAAEMLAAPDSALDALFAARNEEKAPRKPRKSTKKASGVDQQVSPKAGVEDLAAPKLGQVNRGLDGVETMGRGEDQSESQKGIGGVGVPEEDGKVGEGVREKGMGEEGSGGEDWLCFPTHTSVRRRGGQTNPPAPPGAGVCQESGLSRGRPQD